MRNVLFVVDDDETTCEFIQAVLGEEYDITCFLSAAGCLESLKKGNVPEVFLLDVQMPEMDGYELCSAIKKMQLNHNPPVIFISSSEQPEDILAAYDAGAEDYIVKPIDPFRLSKKIRRLLEIEKNHQSLIGQAADAEFLSSLLMDNLNENAILIRYLRALNECHDYEDVIGATLKALDAYQLAGAVQLRTRNEEKTLSTSGENWPMEIAVLKHVRTLGRIFEFKSRSVYNFGPVTVLVTNMPMENPERCGRIRDNLAIVAECAEAKLEAIESSQDRNLLRGELSTMMGELSKFVVRAGKNFDEAKATGGVYTAQLLNQLGKMISALGVTCQQEDEVLAVVGDGIENVHGLFAFAGDSAEEFEGLRVQLEKLLKLTVCNNSASVSKKPTEQSDGVELF